MQCPASWDEGKLGPPPHAPNNNIPPIVKMRMNDRLRKREQRRRDADAAAARQAEADRRLHNELLKECAEISWPALISMT